MGHGASADKATKKRADENVVAAVPSRSTKTRPSRTNRSLPASDAINTNMAIYSNTQVEVETKVSSQHPSSAANRRNSTRSRNRNGSQEAAPKAVITERMVSQFIKERRVDRDEEKRLKEQSVFDWCNELQFPVPANQDALQRHEASMAVLRQMAAKERAAAPQ